MSFLFLKFYSKVKIYFEVENSFTFFPFPNPIYAGVYKLYTRDLRLGLYWRHALQLSFLFKCWLSHFRFLLCKFIDIVVITHELCAQDL